MAKNIVKVEDKKTSKLDLNKIKDVIVDNKDTIAQIVDIAEDLLDDKDTKKKGKSSKSSKKTSKSKSSSLDTVLDIAGKFLK